MAIPKRHSSPQNIVTVLSATAFRSALKWRRILPCGQLLLCIFLIAPLYRVWLPQIHDSIAAYSNKPVTPVPSELRFLILKEEDEYPAELRGRRLNFERRVWTPAALNFPAGALDIPYAMFSSNHEEWHPSEMDFLYWRALTWPLAGIVFWWSAGKCVDGLILARRSVSQPLSWVHPVLGIWEVLTGGALYAVGLTSAGRAIGDPPPEIVCTSGIVWVLLGAATIAGFWQQRRLQRTARANS